MCSRIGEFLVSEVFSFFFGGEIFQWKFNFIVHRITLGNQLDGIRLVDPELIAQFQKRYPDGNCMIESGHKKN